MLHLVTGGSGSGKSAFAEKTVCQYHANVQGKLVYIATMLPYGEETKRKILRHRKMREHKGFQTIEQYTGLENMTPGALAEGSYLKEKQEQYVPGEPDSNTCILLECISNLTANEMYEEGGAGEDTVEAVIRGVKVLKERCRHFVIVTNEVCSECASDSARMAVYKQRLGAINCALAEMADVVTEVVCQIPVTVKGGAKKKKDACLPLMPFICPGRTLKKEVFNMRMIIGGAYQGKLAYAKSEYKNREWLDGEACSFEEIYVCEGIFHFEGYLRRMMEADRDTSKLAEEIMENNPDIVIICAEIGCGLVPVGEFEREYREQTGRVCTELAACASRVDRVICGIGMVLKGE